MCRKIVFEICRMRATNESRVLSHARYVRPAKIPLASGNSGITGLPKTSSQFLTRQLTNTTSDGCAQREQIRDDRTQRPVAGAARRVQCGSLLRRIERRQRSLTIAACTAAWHTAAANPARADGFPERRTDRR